MDYFAVSLPDLMVWDANLNDTNRIHCLYMMALGHIGLSNIEKGTKFLRQIEDLDPNHLGAKVTDSYLKTTIL